MTSIKAHFDGTYVILDEPAVLAAGQPVRVLVERTSAAQPPVFAATPGMLSESSDETHAVRVNPADRVPADFIRQPGSAAGQISVTADFDQTPEEFKEYL